MTTRTAFLGNKPVNRVGYRAMQLGVPACSARRATPTPPGPVLRRAIELGVDHIDTSQYYGPDVVND